MIKRNLLKGIPWRFGPNWPAKDVKQKLEKEHLVNAQLNYQWGDVGFTEVLAQVQRLKKV